MIFYFQQHATFWITTVSFLHRQKILSDFDLPFRLACDANGVAIGAVLSQVVNGKERPTSFFSKVLSKQQRNWTVTERELYALLIGYQQCR